jgi:hypothetical protein
MKLKAFISSATSNRSIIEHRSVSLWWQIILLFFSLIMISFPFIVGRFNVNQEYLDANFPDFTQDFVLALNSSDCTFVSEDDVNLVLTCPMLDQVIQGERYTIYLLPNEERVFNREAIVFFDDSLRVTLSPEQTLEGSYIFGEKSFDQILLDMNNPEFDITPKAYALNILRNIDLMALPTDIWFIYSSITVQYIMYLSVISLLIWWLYSRKGGIKLPFKEITGMLIVIMFWTALPTAVLGFFISVLASVMFTIGYVTRIIFMYTKLTRIIRV